MRILIAVLLLAGCASAQNPSWPDFRTARTELSAQQILNGPNKSAPREAINAYALCTTDYLLHYTSPEDKAVLDAWAQGKRSFSKAENDAYESRTRAAGAVTIDYDTYDALNGTCPEQVPLFKKYLARP
jgi:hypothetical protein